MASFSELDAGYSTKFVRLHHQLNLYNTDSFTGSFK